MVTRMMLILHYGVLNVCIVPQQTEDYFSVLI